MPGRGQRGKPKTGFPSPPTSPWKSLSRFPHSRSPGHYRHGKVEIQKQDSHFSTADFPVRTKQKTKGDQPQPETLSFRLISGLEYAVRHNSGNFRTRSLAIIPAGPPLVEGSAHS
jgi:hypothetical protein